MDTLEAIFTRRSVRQFTAQPITDEDLHTILKAGMTEPSCVNAKDWSFVLVRDKARLDTMADANGTLRRAVARLCRCRVGLW